MIITHIEEHTGTMYLSNGFVWYSVKFFALFNQSYVYYNNNIPISSKFVYIEYIYIFLLKKKKISNLLNRINDKHIHNTQTHCT